MFGMFSKGWPAVLSSLKCFLETGQGLQPSWDDETQVRSRGRRRRAHDRHGKFKPKTVYVTYIAATPEKVWQALTDPAFTRAIFLRLAVDVEPKRAACSGCSSPTAAFTSAARLSSGRRRGASLTWLVEGMKDFGELPECLVSYDIEPSGDAVASTMTEPIRWDVPAAILAGGEPAGPNPVRASRACWRWASRSAHRRRRPAAGDDRSCGKGRG